MAETIRDVVVKIRLEQQQAKLTAPDTTAVEAAIRKVNQAVAEANKQQAVSHDKTIATATAAAEKQVATTLQVAGAYQRAGAGVLQFARGLAFLNAGQNDNVRAALQMLAAAQAVVDMYGGMVTVVRSVTTANAALAASNAAVAASEKLKGGASSAGGAVNVGRMAARGGPAGLLVAGAATLMYLDSMGERHLTRREEADRDHAQRIADTSSLQAQASTRALDHARQYESILESQHRLVLSTLEADKARATEAERILRYETDRKNTLDEVVGRLDPAQLAEVERLKTKAESGATLAQDELATLERLLGPLAESFVSRQFAERGRAAGGAERFRIFAEGDLERSAAAKAKAQATLGETGTLEDINKQIEMTTIAAQQQLTNQRALIGQLTRTLELQNEAIEQSRARIAAIEAAALKRRGA